MRGLLGVLVFLVVLFAISAGMAALVWLLWNAAAVPAGARPISYWVAFGLWLLIGILFRMVRGGSSSATTSSTRWGRR